MFKLDARKSVNYFVLSNGESVRVVKQGGEFVVKRDLDKPYLYASNKNEAIAMLESLESDLNKTTIEVATKKEITKIEIDAKTIQKVEGIKERATKQNNIVMLSNTSKLGAKSWSLQALNTCPASIDANGNLVDACSGCYATVGNYRFSNVKATREYNKQVWQHEDFVNDFVKQLNNETFFRWFDSGDLYSLGLAKKIYEIMKQTPHVKHWLPTRMYKFKKFEGILKDMQALPNVVIRLSSDSIQGEMVASDLVNTNSTIIDGNSLQDYDGFTCPAYAQDGKCLECRACYSKDVMTVAYVAHGVKMKSQHKKISLTNI